MAARNPQVWLMTDERSGAALWPALRRLPPGSGVVFRHYRTPQAERLALYRRVRRLATARRLVLHAAAMPGAAHRHNGPRPTSAAAHDRREALAAVGRGARILFVSPIFATRSHPGAAALGARRAARIVRGLPVEAIALGGMTAMRWRQVRRLGFDGWAAIDALTDQKRKAVPR